MSTPILRKKVGETEYQDFPLDQPTCTVGRSRECDITVNDTSLSRLHFRLEDREGTWFLVDNNSSNGTFLNRRKVKESPLIHGDLLIAGRVHFTFCNAQENDGSETKPMPAMPSVARTVAANLDDFHPDSFDAPPTPMGMDETHDEPIDIPSPPPMEPPAPMAPPPPLSTHEEAGPTTQLESEFAPAEPVYRLLSLLIDYGVLIALTIPGIVLIILDMGLIGSLLQLLGGLAAFAQILVGWLKYRKSIGMHVLKLHIEELEDPDATELPPKVVVMRLLGFIVCSLPCYLLFITVLIDPDRRGLHDKWSGTRVVRAKS